MTDNSATPPTHSSNRSLYFVLGGTLFLRIGGGVMGILTGLFLATKNLEILREHQHHPYEITATLVGIITASFFATELAGSFISGKYIDHHGPRRYMILGPLFGAAAMLITALLYLSPDSPPFQFVLFLGLMLLARLLEGSAAAAANPASLAYIASYTTHNDKLRSRISGYFELVTLIGSILGVVIGGRLFQSFRQTAFLLNMGFYLLSAGIFFLVPYVKSEVSKTSEHHNFGAYKKLMGSPRLRELIPAWLAVSGILGVLFNHATFQLSSGRLSSLTELSEPKIIRFAGQSLSHAFEPTQVSMVFGIYAIAFALGIVIWSQVIHRMRKSTAMLISGVGIIAASIIIIMINHSDLQNPTPTLWILVVLMCLAVMVESGFTPAALIYLSDISESHSENRGMVMGLYSFLFGLGQLLGTIIAGPFADWDGVDGLLLFMGILAVLSILSVLLLRRDEVWVEHKEHPTPVPQRPAIKNFP